MTYEESVAKARQKIKRARSIALGSVSTVGLSRMIDLELEPCSDLPTMATDGQKVYFNPDFTNNLLDEEVLWVLLHEGAHIASCHHLRRGDRDPLVYNIACDYSVNGDLDKLGKGSRPDGALWHQEHSTSGRSVEYIYNQIIEEQEGSPDPGEEGEDSDDDCDGDSSGTGEEDGEGQGQGQGDDGDNDESSASGENTSQDPSGDPSGQGEQPGEGGGGPKPVPGFGGVGEIWDAPPDVNPTEEEEQVVQRLSEASMLERAAGSGAGSGIVQKVAKARGEVAQWGFLHDILKAAYSCDKSINRPNRRHISRGDYFPGRIREGGTLHVAVDTSGSVSRRELEMYLANVRGIAETLGISTLKIAYIDWIVHKDKDGNPWQEIDVSGGEKIDFKSKGGGGTTFDPIFKEIEDTSEDVTCLIYMTDGYGSISVPEPEYPVVWLTSGRKQGPYGHSWGDIVDVSAYTREYIAY